MKKHCLTLLTITVLSSLVHAQKISVSVNPGETFKKRAPQIALWIENEEGKFIETLYITKKASAVKWIGSPKDGRPESLPDWYKASGHNPAKTLSSDELDATTSATPKKGFIVTKELSLEKGKTYTVKCQVNQSFDYNEKFTKQNSGVDGQPAVLYKGSFEYTDKITEIQLELIPPAEGTTTAKDILSRIYVELNPNS